MPYEVTRTGRRKTVGIEVSPYRGVMVRAPRRVTHKLIKEILYARLDWIHERLSFFQGAWGIGPERRFESGERLLFLGRWLSLKLSSARIEDWRVSLRDGCLCIGVPDGLPEEKRTNKIRTVLTDWYRSQAQAILWERVTFFVPEVGVRLPRVTIGNARTTWGSCGYNGQLNLSWRIVMAPMGLVDYVVVHELCHILRKDHSSAFWNLVGSILPDYETRRERLRRDGPVYDL